MARDPFGQPIIGRDVTGATRTPFADNLRNRYGAQSPGFGNRFQVDFTNPRTSMRQDDRAAPGGTMNRGGGMWRSPGVDQGTFNQDFGGGGTARPYQPGGQPRPDQGAFNQNFGGTGRANQYQPGYPAPRATLSPVETGRSRQDWGAPLNNLTPRFDPNAQRAPDNPWGRGGNINQGLHGLLAQLLGNRGGRS